MYVQNAQTEASGTNDSIAVYQRIPDTFQNQKIIIMKVGKECFIFFKHYLLI